MANKTMNQAKGLRLLLAAFVIASLGVWVFLKAASAGQAGTVSGTIFNASGPIPGARVRIRATDNLTFTADSGQFTLGSLVEGQEVEVAAWADGFYIASAHVTPTVSGLTLTLRPYHTHDHPDYAWVSPITGTSQTACENCHPMIFPQWEQNAHGGAVSNRRFFSLYNGTNLSGTAQVGPGYLNDFPDTAGVCAECHAPGAGVDAYLTTDMNTVQDVITAGIHCDYCHKIGGVYLNPVTQSVYPNAPGTRSQRVLRPPPGDDIFFGPYDDIHDPDTYLPAISESQFCAPCHQFSMWGTPIYESYEEWLASPYATDGVTCQDCHMPPNGDTFFARPEVGGLEHPPESIPSHLQLGAMDSGLLQDTATLSLSVRQVAGQIQVTVTITNSGAGHHIPTDYPGRHLLLFVTAEDAQSHALPILAGPRVPSWGGAEAGSPGKGYAKLLLDVESGNWPVVSYWKQSLILEDNRIPALGADTSRYIFTAPNEGGPIRITARLVLRRAYQAITDQKGWDVPDFDMEAATMVLFSDLHKSHNLPVIFGPSP